MPYIKADDGRREKLIEGDTARSAGELNFQIFSYVKHLHDDVITKDINDQIKQYVENFLGSKDKRNYQAYNNMTGALMCCYKEIKRRLGFKMLLLPLILDSYDMEIAMYEDRKVRSNGDVL